MPPVCLKKIFSGLLEKNNFKINQSTAIKENLYKKQNKQLRVIKTTNNK